MSERYVRIGRLLTRLAYWRERARKGGVAAISDADVINQRKAGAPVKQVRPQEGVGITRNSMALLKNAPHPNAAKLWIEWNLSEEGQKALAAAGLGPVRKGVKAAEPEAAIGNSAILPRDDTPEAIAKLGDRVKRWEDALFK